VPGMGPEGEEGDRPRFSRVLGAVGRVGCRPRVSGHRTNPDTPPDTRARCMALSRPRARTYAVPTERR
jgi:hypothetical protein